MSGSGTFVYLLEEEAVAAMLLGWPADMQVAVCLTPGGGCDLAVHHRSELSRVLDRIATLHGLHPEDLFVAPRVEGYPTRKVLFSEEQQLLSFVADSPNLAELASDYAINYRFARDEGLDQDVLARAAVGERPVARKARAPRTAPSAAASHPMSPRSTAFITHLSLPSGYAAPTPAQRQECIFVDGRLKRAGDKVRLVIAPDKAKGTEPAIAVTRIGCRDDFARFVLPRSLLEGWSPDKAAVFEMAVDLFPQAVIDRYMREPHHCQVTVTVRGVFVSFGAPVAARPAEPRPAAPVVAARPKRRLLKSVHVAVAALVAMMVATGHFATALDRAPLRTASAYDSGYGADAALDLMSTMASADAMK